VSLEIFRSLKLPRFRMKLKFQLFRGRIRRKVFVLLSVCLFVSFVVIYYKELRFFVRNIVNEPLEAAPKDFIEEEVSFRIGSCNSLRNWPKSPFVHLVEEAKWFEEVYKEDFSRVSQFMNIADNLLDESCFLRHGRRYGSSSGVLWPRRFYHFPNVFHNDTIRWEDKKDALFWRGSATGPIKDEEEVPGKTNRRKLVELAQSYNRSDIDVGFSSLLQFEEEYLHLKKSSTPETKIFEFKYVLNIEGNDWSSSFPRVLYSWSCPFHPYPFSAENVFFRDLKPWVHFVPLYLNGSDLLEKLQYCRANENICKQIGENGRDMMQRFMNETVFHEINRRVLKRLSHILDASRTANV